MKVIFYTFEGNTSIYLRNVKLLVPNHRGRVTGLTTGFGFDKSALKAETVGLIGALFTRARCALM